MIRPFVFLCFLLASNVSGTPVVDEYKTSQKQGSHSADNLYWQSNLEYQSPTEYYNEDDWVDEGLDEFRLVERKNSELFAHHNLLCPSGETGQYPHPTDCKRFINCWKGRGAIQVCAPGTLFNSETRECDFPGKVRCIDQKYKNQLITTHEKYVRFPVQRPSIAENPRIPRNQNNGKLIEASIPAKPYPGPPPYFGPSHLKPPTRVMNRSHDNALLKPQCPPGAMGLYPHPQYCSKFIKCWSGGMFIQDCGPGTFFNPRLGACDHSRNVDCLFKTKEISDKHFEAITQEKIENKKFAASNQNENILKNQHSTANKFTTNLPSIKPPNEEELNEKVHSEALTGQRQPKIINIGNKDKSFSPDKEIPTYLMPPTTTSESFKNSHVQNGRYNSFASNSLETNHSPIKPLLTYSSVTNYPSQGPYSQFYAQNPSNHKEFHQHSSDFLQGFSKGNGYNNHHNYHQQHQNHQTDPSLYAQSFQKQSSMFPHQYHSHQTHNFENIPATWLQPPHIAPQQAQQLPQQQPQQQPHQQPHHQPQQQPQHQQFYASIKPFQSNDPSSFPHVPEPSFPFQTTPPEGVYGPNLYSFRPGLLTFNSFNSQLPSLSKYYPFYVLQIPDNQNGNLNAYSPQVQFQPMPVKVNAEYPLHDNFNKPNQLNPTFDSSPHKNSSTTFLPVIGTTDSEHKLFNKLFESQGNFITSTNSPSIVESSTKNLMESQDSLESDHPNNVKTLESQNKDYILNKIDVRINEKEKDIQSKVTPQELEDVETIDILNIKPNKYFKPENKNEKYPVNKKTVKTESDVESSLKNDSKFSIAKPTANQPHHGADNVISKVKQTPPNGQMLRLRNGASHLDGYLEMKNNKSQWGLVCDEIGAWNIKIASIACRELGFVKGAELSWQGYPVRSDDENFRVSVKTLNCTGNESSLEDCKMTPSISSSECNVGRNAVGLRCFDNLASHCQPGEILYNRHCYKLHEKENPDDPGINTEFASENCKKLGGKLVDITSQYENDFISEWLIKKHPGVNSVATGGIGISVLGRPMWIWEGTDDPMLFERWWSGWSGKQKIPKGSINGPLCIVLKKTYACVDGEDLKEKEKVKDETCSADYFFWDVENCNELQTSAFICKRPMDDIGCVIDNGEGYLGTANTTASGKACLAWDHPKAVEGLARRAYQIERSSRLLGHNYCRNIGKPDRHPWCFVEGKENSEYCAIPQCWDAASGYHQTYGAFFSCDENQFECKPGECIEKNGICNGQKDCSNNRDEEMCKVFFNEFKTFKNKRMNNLENEKWPNINENTCSKLCLQNKNFKCRSFSYDDTNIGLSGRVINETGWIYGELIRETIHCTFENGYFGCLNGKCLNISEVCDGKMQCDDGSDEKGCDKFKYEIRLNGSQKKHKGRVEVKLLGRWGVICDDMFDLRDANVVCRELGYHLGASEVLPHSYYPLKNPIFLIDDLNCSGNETSIKQCSFPGWGKHNCGWEETVGVACRELDKKCQRNEWKCKNNKECIPLDFLCDHIPDCEDESDESPEFCQSPTHIRLANGSDNASGRLEIRHFGVWGTVCDDDFNVEAAKVVCRFLGYYGPAEVKKNGYYGPGKGVIWLDEVYCAGNESNLEDCTHPPWGKHNCKHDEDVGVVCQQKNLNQEVNITVPIASASIEETYLSKEAKVRRALISECGEKSKTSYTISPFEKVVGGNHVAKESVPWQASIRVKSGTGKSIHWCGAIIISPYHILTAGHCLRDYNKAAYVIRVGDFDTETYDLQEQEFEIDHLYIHPNFSKKIKLNNDIGLVKVKGEIDFGHSVKPACLAVTADLYRPGTNCTVSGWGSVSARSAGFARTLRWAHIPILEDSICKASFVYGNSISEGMFCAGYLNGGADSCQGDSGGPLTCRHEGKDYLFGVTSWGHGCGRANKPGVYTKVALYLNWIQKKIKSSLL